MQWMEAIQEQLAGLKSIKPDYPVLKTLVACLDLTSLNESDTEASIALFCEKAKTPFGHVAAVCLYPSFVRMAASTFQGTAVNVATVVNFPQGDHSLEQVLVEIGRAIEDGAKEIDVVFPYERFLAGEEQYAHQFVAACKAACGTDALLKVILETGVLIDAAIIAEAAYASLTAGADFIKTSTGKVAHAGATLEAAATMLLVIRHLAPQLKRRIGLKVSGGIQTVRQATAYYALANHIMGEGWATPSTFRIGASKLLDDICSKFE